MIARYLVTNGKNRGKAANIETMPIVSLTLGLPPVLFGASKSRMRDAVALLSSIAIKRQGSGRRFCESLEGLSGLAGSQEDRIAFGLRDARSLFPPRC